MTGSDGRKALLTDKEREALRGEGDYDANYRSSVVARVRKRLDRLETDLDILREHHLLGKDLPDDVKSE